MKKLEGANVLVTGASGYIGQHLIRRLQEIGTHVGAFCRESSKPIETCCRRFSGDIRNYADVAVAVAEHDLVVHLACVPISVCAQQPELGFAVNALGSSNVAQACATFRRPLLYVSTSEVYGPGQQLPMVESHPTHPISPYGASKLCGEVMCQMWARLSELPILILRLFNVYGPAADGSPRPTVETVFLKCALQNQPIVFQHPPESARDFIYITDVVNALVLGLEHLDRSRGKAVNIGSGTAVTLKELYYHVTALTGLRATLRLSFKPQSPVHVYQADIKAARDLLSFIPTVTLDRGLKLIRCTLDSRQEVNLIMGFE